MKTIKIKCLNCSNEFELKSNGVKYRHYERDNSIRVRKSEEPLECPECKEIKLVFIDYHEKKLKYPL